MTAARAGEYVTLQHTPGSIEARNVTNGNEAMQVSLYVKAGYFSADLYLTADEARRVAAGLTAAAEQYDTNQRKAA